MPVQRLVQPLALASLLTLIACAVPEAPAGAAPGPVAAPGRIGSGQPPANRCQADAARFLVGQLYAPDTLRRALAAAGADEARLLRPDSVITKEYKMGRLNVVVGADQRVVEIHCG